MPPCALTGTRLAVAEDAEASRRCESFVMNTGKKKAPTHRVFNDVSGLFTWSWWPDLNRRPADYEL